MADVHIQLLEKSDEAELFRFEQENRVFFTREFLSRPDDYYIYGRFQNIIDELIDDQEKDLAYFYLAKSATGEILGRVNLVSVRRGNLQKAELGYRVGERHQGQGYATRAVEMVLANAVKIHGLHRLEAGTSPENIGSQIVLIRNGFQFVGRWNQYIFQGERWVDSLNFEKILD